MKFESILTLLLLTYKIVSYCTFNVDITGSIFANNSIALSHYTHQPIQILLYDKQPRTMALQTTAHEVFMKEISFKKFMDWRDAISPNPSFATGAFQKKFFAVHKSYY